MIRAPKSFDWSFRPFLLVGYATLAVLVLGLGGWGVLAIVASRPTKAEDRLKRMLDRPQLEARRLGADLDRKRIQDRVAEAARRLGVPEGTVKSRTHYALRALKLALEEMGVSA